MLNFVKSHGIQTEKEKVININSKKDKLIFRNKNFII